MRRFEMKAVTFHGKRDIRVDNVPDPAIRSRPMPWSESPQKKEDGAIKVVLEP
jgi:hypothetical protein